MTAENDKAAGATANAAWGGRFAGGPAEIMQRINVSIDFDKRLYAQDIAGSLAHCAMLVRQRILSAEDGAAITRGLEQIRAEIESGDFAFRTEHEDIHLNIEARLREVIGPAAGRLHTARSRNDQVATDFRLWVRDAIDRLDRQTAALQAALIDQAERHAGTIMPGFTHLQVAQPITFGHHLLAYVEMLGRPVRRLPGTAQRMPARLGGAGRHVVSLGSGGDGSRLGVRSADRQFDRRRLRSRLRAGISRRRIDRRHASVAPCRRDRHLGERALPLHPPE
jgi:argininosuccinate lyase